MRIILLGAPGTGKGTQAQFIIEKYNIPKISTGDILRAAIKVGSELGNKAKAIMYAGHLVTDELVIDLVKYRLMQKDCQKGFLLDGFPRTLRQVKAIEEENIKIDKVLEFIVPDIQIVKRIIGRRIHIPSGRVYHTIFNPPKITGKDDLTGEPLTIRKDDQEEIVLKRLAEYHQVTAPLVNFYKKEAKEGNICYHVIDGTCKISEINSQLVKILSEF